MTSSTNMNVILGQGNAIKEIHNVKKQSLEVNQQFTAQQSEDRAKKEKSKVQDFEAKDKVEIKDEAKRDPERHPKKKEKDTKTEEHENTHLASEERLLDITVS